MAFIIVTMLSSCTIYTSLFTYLFLRFHLELISYCSGGLVQVSLSFISRLREKVLRGNGEGNGEGEGERKVFSLLLLRNSFAIPPQRYLLSAFLYLSRLLKESET